MNTEDIESNNYVIVETSNGEKQKIFLRTDQKSQPYDDLIIKLNNLEYITIGDELDTQQDILVNNDIPKQEDKSDELDEYVNFKQKVMNDINSDKDLFIQQDLTSLLKTLHVFTSPQKYGCLIQDRLISDYNLEKIPSSEDKGDAKNINNKYGEIKVSYAGEKDQLSFLQIRPYQNCDFYVLYAIIPQENYKGYSFIIKKNEIEQFMYYMCAANCHGVDRYKVDKTRNEYRISVKYNSDKWEYLIKNHLCENPKLFISNLY